MNNTKTYTLAEVDGPRLLEDIFPHELPPRNVFESEPASRDGDIASRAIRITDTTFRDGQQGWAKRFTAEQIARLYETLSEISGPNGVVQECEFFLYRDEDIKAVRACQRLGRAYPKITGWMRGSGEDGAKLKWMQENGVRETGLLTPSSDYHIFFKLRSDRRKAWEKYLATVQKALDRGIRPRCHLEDVTRADLHGFVLPFVQELMRISESLAEDMKIKIRLCDTMGFGLPDPYAAPPRGVPKLVNALRHEAGVPSRQLEWHGHNDLGKGHANALAAWLYGCDLLNTTLSGFGERTGNCPLEQAVFEYVSLKHTRDGMNTQAITGAVAYLKDIGIPIPSTQPIVGTDAFTTKAGIHIKGIEQDERIYMPFDSNALLGRDPGVILNDKSGPEGVTYCVNLYLKQRGLLSGKDTVTQKRAIRIIHWWDQEYKTGRTDPISVRELEEEIRRHLPEYFPAGPMATQEGRA